MKRIALIVIAFFVAVAAQSQTLLSEDFSNGLPEGWSMFNDENLPYHAAYDEAWVLNTQYGNEAPCMASTSWFSTPAQADRWLITPGIAIPGEGYYLTFDARALEGAYPDGLEIRVSTQGPTDRLLFREEALLTVNRCSANWTEYMVDLSEFAGQNVWLAFVQNSLDMNLLLIDNVTVGVPPQNAIALRQLYLPSSVTLSTQVPVRGMIVNRGMAPLTSFDVTYTVDGRNQGTTHFSSLNLEHGEAFTFTCDNNFFSVLLGTYNICVTVSNPNGVADDPNDNTLDADIIVFDSNLIMPRLNIAEVMTLNSCAIFPQIWQEVEMASEMVEPNVLILAHHAGTGTDPLTCDGSIAIERFYNGQAPFIPAIMYNRSKLSSTFRGPLMGVSSLVKEVGEMMETADALPSYVRIAWNNMTFDEDSRELNATVSGRFTYRDGTETPRITVYMVEDSVYKAQRESTGWNFAYRHMQVVRDEVATIDCNDISYDGNYSYNISYTIPESMRAWRCRLVAIMANHDNTNINNNRIMNATVSDRVSTQYIGIDQVASGITVDIYPNPTADMATVEANGIIRHIEILNMMGQQVYSARNINESNTTLNVGQLPKGIYMVRIETDHGCSVTKLSVAR